MINSTVRDFCCSNNTQMVKQLLNIFDDIDVLYKSGTFFDFAITKGNVEICGSLIEYFEQKQYPVKNSKYELAKAELIEVLANATDGIKLSADMKEILSQYIELEANDNSSLGNESDLSDIMIQNDSHTTGGTVIQKAFSMKNLKLSLDNIHNLNKLSLDTDDYEVHSAGEVNHDLSL